jgi:hypothetical protein
VNTWGFSLFERAFSALFLLTSVSLGAAQSKPLPPGPMQAKVKATCTQCHNASRITEQHLTRQEWSEQLDKMVALGAEVPDSDRPALLNYLSRNFGPQKGGKAAPKKSAEETK